MLRMLGALLLLCLLAPARAQFTMQDSGTAADLRGIVNVGNGTAWASGNHGTVLRTEDSGFVWQGCAVPPGGEQLDFRGIQAFDDQTAIVMSSGKGGLSRVYKTTDGCQSWKLVFTNPDAEGFWDAIVSHDGRALLIGDPITGRFQMYASQDGKYEVWKRFGEEGSNAETFRFDLNAVAGESLFAASNSTLLAEPASHVLFVSGGPLGSFASIAFWKERSSRGYAAYTSYKSLVPLAKSPTAGAFSFAARLGKQGPPKELQLVAVGGDYKLPDATQGTAAWTKNGGQHWTAAKTLPHGFRSSVAYDAKTKTWITVGPNGTDTSMDDGRNWQALKPGYGDEPDADRQWNALSLPYVVGPHGRIGRLRDNALPQSK